MTDEQKLRELEARVEKLERRLNELVRLLKRSKDEDVQHAARRAR